VENYFGKIKKAQIKLGLYSVLILKEQYNEEESTRNWRVWRDVKKDDSCSSLSS